MKTLASQKSTLRLMPILTITALTLTAILPAASAEEIANPPAAIKEAVEQNKEPGSVAEKTNRLIVTFAEGTDDDAKNNALANAENKAQQLEDVKTIKTSVAQQNNTIVISTDKALNSEDQQKAAEALKADPRIAAVEPDKIVNAVTANPTSDPDYPRLWAFSTGYMNVAGAWDSGVTGAGQTVGIVDTGYSTHPDLAAPVASYDFVTPEYLARDGDGRDSDARDMGNMDAGANWHGTFVNGEINARANGIGVTGVAYNADVNHARALGLYGNGYVSDIADAITWSAGGTVAGVPANPGPATVINASLAYPSDQCSSVMSSAINYALGKNIPVVVAAGNSGDDAARYEPANCYRAIVVGASTSWNTLTAYSNWGNTLDVVAPGGTTGNDIYSTTNTGNSAIGTPTWGNKNGTSMATPYVSGTIALMKEANPGLSVEQIRQILVNTGTNVSGYSQINTEAAVRAARAAAPKAPVTPATPAQPAQPATPKFTLVPGSGIAGAYNRYGGQGVFGDPTSNETGSGYGVYQKFAKDRNIYWTAQTGAHPVALKYGIGGFFTANGAETSLGFPTMAETGITGGAMQKFRIENGKINALYWSAATGTHRVWEAGAIGGKFTRNGGTNALGFPTEEEQYLGTHNGYRQTFTKDGRINIVYWAPHSGAHTVHSTGDIFAKWQTQGGLINAGYPTTDQEQVGAGVQQIFRLPDNAGTAYIWHGQYGTHSMNANGAFYGYWKRNVATLGYPVTDETGYPDGSASIKFSNGTELRWNARTGMTIHS